MLLKQLLDVKIPQLSQNCNKSTTVISAAKPEFINHLNLKIPKKWKNFDDVFDKFNDECNQSKELYERYEVEFISQSVCNETELVYRILSMCK